MCIHKNLLINPEDDEYIPPDAFRSHADPRDPTVKKGYMSTDWNKYSTPLESRNRRKIPLDNGVVSLNTGETRSNSLYVDHAPLSKNRAHSVVHNVDNHEKKMKKMKIRRMLSRIAKWEIHVN